MLERFRAFEMDMRSMNFVKGGVAADTTSWDCVDQNGNAVIVSTVTEDPEELFVEIDNRNEGKGPKIVGCEATPM